MDELSELFDDAGELEIPTMRGSANLDVQDYQGYDGRSELLDDELQEDTPSRPGSGAAPAPDVEGTSEFDLLDDIDMDAPGMDQSEWGASPWGPGSSAGYRPYSQQRTGMDLRALSGEEEHMPEPKPAERDSMHDEPEVINAVPVKEPVPWQDEWHGERNQQPSNAQVDPMTLYDRTSYEYDESSQDIIGSGIFSMEEGVTWRPRDGMFANQYAMPAYMADEDEMGVQQSEMWDSTAGEWRVTQPTAGGVPLARRVASYKPPFGDDPAPAQMRPEVTGPRSHIEAFGRRAASCIVREAQAYPPERRGAFLKAALDSLGPGGAKKAKVAADRLTRMGYSKGVAFEDAAAHLVMHAAVNDLVSSKRKRKKTLLPRLDAMSRKITGNGGELRQAAMNHVMPLTENSDELRKDLGALYASPAGRGMGAVTNGGDQPASTSSGNGSEPGLLRPRNLLIAGGVGLGAYLLFANRQTIAKNVKKWTK